MRAAITSTSWLLAAGLTLGFGRPAAQAKDASAEQAALGGLHRVAATLDATLGIYRLALVELVPAAKLIREAGTQKGAGPGSSVPEPATAVAWRLAGSFENRVPAAALPVITRGYHAEVVSALVDLGGAKSIGQVRAPLHVVLRAMRAVCDSAADIVDLFSRQRPLVLRIVDPATVLDDIGEALDQVGAAERQIVRLRQRHSPLGDQLHAFLQLEVSLAHALDLIAGAEEAGIHIGFEMQLSTSDFDSLLEHVRAQLVELEKVITDLDAAPAAVPGRLTAALAPVEVEGAIEARLTWTPPRGMPKPVAVRVYRHPNGDGLRRRLSAALRCEGKSADEARRLADEAAGEVDSTPVLVAEIAPGRSAYVDALNENPVAPPGYRLTTVSAFGVESDGPTVIADFVPPTLHGPLWIEAQALSPAAGAEEFYTDFDGVEVRWGLSPNDVAGSDTAVALAHELGAPTVTGYRIVRLEGEKPTRSATTDAGTSSFIDHVPIDALARGVRYVVEAVGSDGSTAQPMRECTTSAPVVADLEEPLRLARLGLGWVRHPTALERRALERLRDRAVLEHERTAFGSRPPEERNALAKRWWLSVPVSRRQQWLRDWPTLFEGPGREAWLQEAAANPSRRDLTLARVDIWLAQQAPEVQNEIERWWDLLAAGGRTEALQRWRASLNRSHGEWLDERIRTAGPEMRGRLLRPARVLAWWEARDPHERGLLEAWWDSGEPAERSHELQNWVEGLSERARLAVRWPDWERLTEEEQTLRLDEAYRQVPDKLWPELLAWLDWKNIEAVGGAALDEAIVVEVGAFRRAVTSLRYATRPLDLRFGFNLPLLATISAGGIAGTAFGIGWRRRRRSAITQRIAERAREARPARPDR
ncbi:MAG: hypothetical protein V3T05_03775 [Myxococcota bacterium]